MGCLEKTRPAWVEVDLDDLAFNMKNIREIVKKDCKITAVIKANGYGHGAVQIADTLLKNGADRFAVATLSEAIELRKVYKNTPILILGYTPSTCAEEVIKNKIIQTIYSLEEAKIFSNRAKKLNKKVYFHIKLDTGMSRIGLKAQQSSVPIIKAIHDLENVEIEGMFTHFAVADEENKDFTYKQYEKFMNVANLLEKEGIHIPVKHVSNSAAIMDLPDMHLDMVRAGIILYGMYPSEEVQKSKLKLKPVLSLKTRISHIKQLEKGMGISYGLKYITSKTAKIGTIPIGYADGLTRMLTGKAKALVGGKEVPLVGRICMDQCMLDLTKVEDVQVGDEVILIGTDGKNTILSDDLAHALNTINYEIVCMMGRRLPRVYVKNHQVVKVVDELLKK